MYKIKLINKFNNIKYFNSIIEESKNLYRDGFNGYSFTINNYPSNDIICAFIVNDNNEQLIGIASLIIDMNGIQSIKKCINFNSFTIDKRYRRKNVGSIMIEYLKKYSKLLNIDAIVLSVDKTQKNYNKLVTYYNNNGFKIFNYSPYTNNLLLIFDKPLYLYPLNNYYLYSNNNEISMKCDLY
jgi:GNAT superfamily N-acetyltransferase